jgi:hypothetical protein
MLSLKCQGLRDGATTLSITTLSIKGLFATLKRNETHHNNTPPLCCHVLFIVMLNGIMLSVIIQNVIMMNVIMSNVVWPVR